MSLSGVAKETLRIVEGGTYTTAAGAAVSVRAQIDRAIAGTRLYRPAQLEVLVESFAVDEGQRRDTRVEVTGETTAAATRRLVSEGCVDVACLNFASAKNPGGGFLGGAKAQEEDLARCSALYACQIKEPQFYDENRKHGSLLYTDHLIWSPAVPFFRDDKLDFVDVPWTTGVVTSPAPNAGEVLRRAPDARPQIESALVRRAGHVLAVLAVEQQRNIVLGAWGCGVFRNDPVFVSRAFENLLASDRFRGAFDRVVFAVYDRSKERSTLRAFEERFG